MFGWIVTSIVVIIFSLWIINTATSPTLCACGFAGFGIGTFILIGSLLISAVVAVRARDLTGQYAGSPLHEWFDKLQSKKGLCCSDADGNVVQDPDWEAVQGKPDVHYRVRIHDQWWDVPDSAVIDEPNKFGRTMVWPIWGYYEGKENIQIRCFMPGAMI